MQFWRVFLMVNFLAVSFSIRAAQVDSMEIFSASMHKTIKCIVIKPDNYTILGDPYPVLYLLHGWSGYFASWLTDAPQLPQLADRYQMMIVCPDGGYDSWYLDSPVDSTVRYDTHVSKEVVGYVDHQYYTRHDRNGRAISGLSMGGHGALSLAIRHPDIFGAAGSICGGLDLRPFKKNDWDLKGVLGSPSDHWDNWEAASVVNLIPLLKNIQMPLLIDCGLDDFFLPVNREMHRLLMENHVVHDYTERPGEHNSAYWSNSVDFQVVFFHKFFVKAK